MEINNKSYQVAYSYQDYIKNTSIHPKKGLMSLPSSIPEEEDSAWQIVQPKPENIFHHTQQNKARKVDLLPAKSYQCVGLKQVQAYASKTDKKKRRINSLLKRTSQSVLSLSRASQSKITDKYLTKEEVMRLYAKENNKSPAAQLEQLYISHQKTNLKKTLSTQNTTVGSLLCTPQQTLRNKPDHEFSMTKLKQKINNYKGQWQRQITWKKLKTSHNRNKSLKLDSILKNSESFRKKMQRLQLNSITEINDHPQPKIWTLMLRNSQSLQRPAIVQKIIKVGIGCRGKSKLSKEMNWVEEKDRLGFYFKGRDSKQNFMS